MVLQLQWSSRNRQSNLSQRSFSTSFEGKSDRMAEQGFNASIVRDLATYTHANLKGRALQRLVHQEEPLTRAGTPGSRLRKCHLVKVHCSHTLNLCQRKLLSISSESSRYIHTHTRTHTHTPTQTRTHTHTHTHPHKHTRTRAQKHVPSQSSDNGLYWGSQSQQQRWVAHKSSPPGGGTQAVSNGATAAVEQPVVARFLSPTE